MDEKERKAVEAYSAKHGGVFKAEDIEAVSKFMSTMRDRGLGVVVVMMHEGANKAAGMSVYDDEATANLLISLAEGLLSTGTGVEVSDSTVVESGTDRKVKKEQLS